jgi:enoyl-CoA hydratase/carnithine racemase
MNAVKVSGRSTSGGDAVAPGAPPAVDSPATCALHAALLAFEDDTDGRVAVFCGAHGHFCAGWNPQHGARLAAQGMPRFLPSSISTPPMAQRSAP